MPHIFKTNKSCPYVGRECDEIRHPSQTLINKEENENFSLISRGDNKVSKESALWKNEADATHSFNVIHIE